MVRRHSSPASPGPDTVLASLPSPSFNSIDIGPLSLNIYGLSIALGVVAAVWLFGRRLEERGAGTTDDASSIGLWAVLAGVIGARLYHVATDWDRFENDLANIPKIWQGGLGIPGGLLFGITAGLLLGRRKGISMSMIATTAAPAIPLAQSIGRWGNYFNQELYGRPTDLPWALEIDDAHLVDGFTSGTTFHPTFLYESLWSLALVFVLLWIDRKFRPALGQLMAMFVIGYGIGRFWIEGLRVDSADELAGLRWNQWVALAAVVVGVGVLAVMRRHPVVEEADPFGEVRDFDDIEDSTTPLGSGDLEVRPDEEDVDDGDADDDDTTPGDDSGDAARSEPS